MTTPQVCPCGSGEPCWAERDGYGIFLCYVCDNCRAGKIAKYRKDIFTQYDTDERIEEDY